MQGVDPLADKERDKYTKVWDLDNYGDHSPGQAMLIPFMHIVQPVKPATLHDYGTGCGRAALYFKLTGMDVSMFDIAENCLDEHVSAVLKDKLTLAPLWDLPEATPVSDYGYCTDVMEHIPPAQVYHVLKEIARTSKECFFHICFHEDHFGEQIDDVLHLTVKPFSWWLATLRAMGTVTDARDLIFNGIYHVRFDHE